MVTSNFTLPALPPSIRPLSNEASHRLNALYPDLPKSPAQCVTCKGAKTFQWYAPGSRDPQSVGTYDCDCMSQFTLHRVMLNSGIGETYQRLSWADFDEIPPAALAAASDYIDNFERYVGAGFGLILHGTMGSGKTLLLYLLLKALLMQGVDVYGASFNQVLDVFSGGWSDKDERARFNKHIRNAGVLLIDDVGRERHQQQYLTKEERLATGTTSGVVRSVSQHAETVLEEVVRHRVSRSMPSLITTNLTLEQIATGYGGNTMSLLHERSTTVEFFGRDFRDQQRERLKSEVRTGLTRPVVLE